jgi:hypothetical protein
MRNGRTGPGGSGTPDSAPTGTAGSLTGHGGADNSRERWLDLASLSTLSLLEYGITGRCNVTVAGSVPYAY